MAGYPFFLFGKKGGDIPMEFLFELLKEIVKGAVREGSALFIRKQILKEGNKKPTPSRRPKQKGGFRKKK